MDPNRIGLQLLLKEINREPKPNRPMRNRFILVFSRSLTNPKLPEPWPTPRSLTNWSELKAIAFPRLRTAFPSTQVGFDCGPASCSWKLFLRSIQVRLAAERRLSELGLLSCCHILEPSPDLTAMLRDWLLTFKSVTIISTAREEAVRSGTTVKTPNKFSAHFHFYAAFTELLLQTNYCDRLSNDSQFRRREDS